jgi:hypothetical protein
MVSRKLWVIALCFVAAIIAPFPVAAIYSQNAVEAGAGTNCADCAYNCCTNETCDCGNNGHAGDPVCTGCSGEISDCCPDVSCDSIGPGCDTCACSGCCAISCAADCTTGSGSCIGNCCEQPTGPCCANANPTAQGSYTGNTLVTQRPVSVASSHGCC